MNLRTVRDSLGDNSTPLSGALLKAKVLASVLRARELREYVDRELRGYAENEPLPSYRQIPADSMGTFVSDHFKPVQNHPVPMSGLPDELRAWASTYLCTDSVGSIEQLIRSADQHMIWMPWPYDNIGFIPEADIGGYGFRCADAARCVSTERLQGVLDNVRNRVLDIVLDLGEQFPEQQDSEDELSRLPTAQVQTIINNHIHGDFATVAAGQIVHQEVHVQQHDVESLLGSLQQVGVPERDREELRAAIEADRREEPGETKIGPRVRAWVGNLATKAAEKSVEGGVTAALPHIIDAVSKFFG